VFILCFYNYNFIIDKMGRDLLCALVTETGEIIEMPRFPRYRWFWERICVLLSEYEQCPQVKSITLYLRNVPRDAPKTIKNHFDNNINIAIDNDCAPRGTWLTVDEFNNFEWESLWNDALRNSVNTDQYMNESWEIFDVFWTEVKKYSGESKLYFYYDI